MLYIFYHIFRKKQLETAFWGKCCLKMKNASSIINLYTVDSTYDTAMISLLHSLAVASKRMTSQKLFFISKRLIVVMNWLELAVDGDVLHLLRPVHLSLHGYPGGLL